MLRVILGTLGVALIAFGLFGGKSLEQVYAGLNGMIDRYSGAGDSEQIVADASESLPTAGAQQKSTADTAPASADSPAVTPVAANAEAPAVTPVVANDAATGVVTRSAEESTNTDDAVASTATVESATSVAASTSTGDSTAGDQNPTVADTSATDADDSKSAITTAVAVADTAAGGALKEVKASARNKELDLVPGNQEGEKVELPKDASVGEVLQTTTGENKVKALFVLKDLVNMREGPSIEHPVVLRLEKGQELMEFKRDGKWVHVGAYGTSGKIGWVHQRLVGKTPG